MNVLELIEPAVAYTQVLETNVPHSFDFFTLNGKLIKYTDYYLLNQNKYKNIKRFRHVGVKQKLTEDLWIFSLFASQNYTMLYDNIIMKNIQLSQNMHKNVNPAIIISNKTFSEYFVVSNNLGDLLLYAKEHYNLNYDNQKIMYKRDNARLY